MRWHHPNYIPQKFKDQPQHANGGVGYFKKEIGTSDDKGIFVFLPERVDQDLVEEGIIAWWCQVLTEEFDGQGIYYMEATPEYESYLLERDPVLAVRTLEEMIKLLIEWAQAPGIEEPQVSVRNFVADLEIPQPVFYDVIESVPDQAVARYLRGNPQAKERDLNVEPMSDMVEDWLVRKIIGEL